MILAILTSYDLQTGETAGKSRFKQSRHSHKQAKYDGILEYGK